MGYAGGEKKNPTYYDLGDHTETVQIDYDPSQVSYDDLLKVFWEGHNPNHNSWSRQYMNIVFYHNDEQKRLAEESLKAIERKTGKEVKTKVLPYTGFYVAEDYHQKHSLQRYPNIMAELKAIYPSFDDFLKSTAVTRVNGYLGGYGTCDGLKDEAFDLGLSAGSTETLSLVVCGNKAVVECPLPR